MYKYIISSEYWVDPTISSFPKYNSKISNLHLKLIYKYVGAFIIINVVNRIEQNF